MCKIQYSITQPLISFVNKRSLIPANKYREIQIKVPEEGHIAFPSQWQYCAAVNIH